MNTRANKRYTLQLKIALFSLVSMPLLPPIIAHEMKMIVFGLVSPMC